jgi:tetratricopeptide (TPR) repeat protein
MPREQAAALLAGGRFHEAMGAHAEWLRREPQSVAARIGLARACAGACDALTAAAWLSDAIRLAPGEAQPVQLLADLALAQRQWVQARPLYRQLFDRFGLRSAANLLHAGFCEEQLGQIEEAAALYRDALAADGTLLEAHVDLAGVLWRLEDFAGALLHAQHAVRLAPGRSHAQRILGTALLQSNRLAQAEVHLRRALQLQPGLEIAVVDLALTLLLAGRLEEGWRWYEQRWRDPRMVRPAFWRAEGEWPGPRQPIAGQSIAVYGEQGRGDVLQFLRYLPRLQALGARVVGIFPPDLAALVEASFPGVQCLRSGQQRVDWHAALLDLAGRFGTTLATVPADVPYLRPPEAARAAWRVRLQAWEGRRKVGLAWCGAPAQVNDRNRSMPLSAMLPLTHLPAVQFFSLQKEDGGAWSDVPLPGEVVDLTLQWQDFGDSAAMVEALDLVITVDTAVAHLAGALGKPVWVLLPPNPDWRWLLGRADSPWYPTLRLFRREFGEPRAAQVARVREALVAWIADAQPGADGQRARASPPTPL